jgi:hypothetical protein
MKKQTQTKKRQNRSRSKKHNRKSIKGGGDLRLIAGGLYTISNPHQGYDLPNVVLMLVRKVGPVYTFRSIYNPRDEVELTREQMKHNNFTITQIELPVEHFDAEIIN